MSWCPTRQQGDVKHPAHETPQFLGTRMCPSGGWLALLVFIRTVSLVKTDAASCSLDPQSVIWTNGYCYALLPWNAQTMGSLADARGACEADGGHLTVVLDHAHATALSMLGKTGLVSLGRKPRGEMKWTNPDNSETEIFSTDSFPIGNAGLKDNDFGKIGPVDKLHMALDIVSDGAFCQYNGSFDGGPIAVGNSDGGGQTEFGCPCLHGGTCVYDALGASVHCHCTDDYTGKTCETLFSAWLARLQEIECYKTKDTSPATTCDWRFV